MQTRSAFVAGTSGLVGGFLLDRLLERDPYHAVCSVGRRPLARQHAKLTQHTVDFTRLEGVAVPPIDDAFCCLGTTIGKAGSREAFRALDHDAVLAFAHAARTAGARRFLLVSSLGADPRSRVFYSRVKGETETDLEDVGFESLILLRPSLLLGDRTESRPAERAAIVVSRALRPLLRPFGARPIEAGTVARAMVALAWNAQPGTRVVLSGELQTLGAPEDPP